MATSPTPSKDAQELAAQVERDGGQALALYQEPVGDHWQIFCLLPMAEGRSEFPISVASFASSRGAGSRGHVERLDRFIEPCRRESQRGPAFSGLRDGDHRRAALQKAEGGDRYPPGRFSGGEPQSALRSSPSTQKRRTTLRRRRWRVDPHVPRPRRRAPGPQLRRDVALPFRVRALSVALGLLSKAGRRFSADASAPILRRVEHMTPGHPGQGGEGAGGTDGPRWPGRQRPHRRRRGEGERERGIRPPVREKTLPAGADGPAEPQAPTEALALLPAGQLQEASGGAARGLRRLQGAGYDGVFQRYGPRRPSRLAG